MSRAEQLAARRALLVARGEKQRVTLLQQRDHIVARLQVVDRSIEWVKRVVEHPLLVVGAAVALIVIGPFKIMRWVAQGAFWFRVAQKAGGLFKSLSHDAPNQSSGGG